MSTFTLFVDCNSFCLFKGFKGDDIKQCLSLLEEKFSRLLIENDNSAKQNEVITDKQNVSKKSKSKKSNKAELIDSGQHQTLQDNQNVKTKPFKLPLNKKVKDSDHANIAAPNSKNSKTKSLNNLILPENSNQNVGFPVSQAKISTKNYLKLTETKQQKGISNRTNANLLNNETKISKQLNSNTNVDSPFQKALIDCININSHQMTKCKNIKLICYKPGTNNFITVWQDFLFKIDNTTMDDQIKRHFIKKILDRNSLAQLNKQNLSTYQLEKNWIQNNLFNKEIDKRDQIELEFRALPTLAIGSSIDDVNHHIDVVLQMVKKLRAIHLSSCYIDYKIAVDIARKSIDFHFHIQKKNIGLIEAYIPLMKDYYSKFQSKTLRSSSSFVVK